VMSIGAIALAFVLAAFPQSDGELQRGLDLLASEEIADRERGLDLLKGLDPALLPQLRLLVGAATDAESRARLSAAVKGFEADLRSRPRSETIESNSESRIASGKAGP